MPKKAFSQDSQSQSNYDPLAKSNKDNKASGFRNQNYSKNYVKNIFMPLIKWLQINKFQHILVDLKVQKQQISKKNSVPIKQLYEVLTHKTFEMINKHEIKNYIRKQISLNSKLHQKEFHLQTLQEIFSICLGISQDQFKRKLGKFTKKIAKNCKKQQNNFGYDSLLLNLMHLFCQILKLNPNLIQNKPIQEKLLFLQKSGNFKSEFLKKSGKNNKKNQKIPKLKKLIKDSVDLMNNLTFSGVKISKLYYFLKNYLQNEQEKFREKNHEDRMRIIVRQFCPQIVGECFKSLQNNKKMTTAHLQRLLINFRKNFFLIQNKQENSKQLPSSSNSNRDSEQNFQVKNIFAPILIVPPSFIFTTQEQRKTFYQTQ